MIDPIPSIKPQWCVATLLVQVDDMTNRAKDLGCAIGELRDDVEPRFRISDLSPHPNERTDDSAWVKYAGKDSRTSVHLLLKEYIATRDALFALYHRPIELLEGQNAK